MTSRASPLIMGLLTGLMYAAVLSAFGSDYDRFKIKRQPVFDFLKAPTVSRTGDHVTIRFTAKAACDATVVVEDKQGRIIRHLASGVLGDNAPPPFEKNTLDQTVTWNGKNDQDVYIDDKDSCTIRVSLGLKPQFEKTLFWTHQRGQSTQPQLLSATKEGVYVYDGGQTIDHVRLYDHDGNYVHTVYPFPANRVQDVKGLDWHTFQQDGAKLPLKKTYMQCTFLTSGFTDHRRDHWNMHSTSASAIAARNGRIALVQQRLNRLATDGTTGGLPLEGATTALSVQGHRGKVRVWPRSAALSPDGRWLYLTGYLFGRGGRGSNDLQYIRSWRCAPVVMRLNVESGEGVEVWKGRIDPYEKPSDGVLTTPTSVAFDAQGRVYVADYIKDRIFIFSPDAKPLKEIEVDGPAQVCVHPKTGEIYVFSYKVASELERDLDSGLQTRANFLYRFGPFENPARKGRWPLPGKAFSNHSIDWRETGLAYRAEVDFWADSPTIWLAEEAYRVNHYSFGKYNTGQEDFGNIQLLRLKDGTLQTVRSFGKDVAKASFWALPAPHHRQRLYVNPKDGCCYVAEADFTAVGKSFPRLHRVDPKTGSVRLVQLPFNAEDMCFDLNGYAYLRTITEVGRYNAETWREIPWDYGEERSGVGFGWLSGTRRAHLESALVIPGHGCWHQGGMHVSPQGRLIVANIFAVEMTMRTGRKYEHRGNKYQPTIFPGRGGATVVHVFDKHGKVRYEDAVPGLADLYGVALDRDDNIYAMSAATRVLDGKPYYNIKTGTAMKLRPKQSRVLAGGTKGILIPLPESQRPRRKPDVRSPHHGDSAWVENAQWLYGGVGFGGKNTGSGCACWNARFAHDYLARTFLPEVDHYSVAILDSAGNLIVRIGRYGNVDDGKPLVAAGSPPNPRSIGGDEVALFHAPYLATHTDKRLFIADPGNSRILSVKLGYHVSHNTALKDVPDEKKP